MKINVINDAYEGQEWHLNPATVCVAERKRCKDGSIRHILNTTDGGIWYVSEDSYKRVIAWMETHE